MSKYICQAQSLIERSYEAENEEDAISMMRDYIMDEYADGDWSISVVKEKVERKIGDIVFIKNQLFRSMPDFVGELEDYEGKEATIISIYGGKIFRLRFKDEVENDCWNWYEDYFQ